MTFVLPLGPLATQAAQCCMRVFSGKTVTHPPSARGLALALVPLMLIISDKNVLHHPS